MSIQNNFLEIKKKIKLKSIFEGEIIEVAKGWKALSPFTKETNPSFKVTETEEGDIWYCFSTRQGGDIFDYYEKIYHVDKKIAFYELAKKAGIKVTNIYSEIYSNDELIELESKLIKDHAFFIKKGISKEILDKYGAGYIEDVSKLNIKSDIVLKYNLAGIKDSIIYLVKNALGKNVGYYCRPLSGGQNKYISYSTLQVYGLHQLNNKSDFVIIVEGQNDVLKLRTEGIDNVLAISGTTFNQRIFDEFRKSNIQKVVFIPDSDNGGFNFLNNIINNYGTFDTYGISVTYAIIPEQNYDPDEYIIKNKDFFINIPEVNPINSYFDLCTGSDIDKLKKILNNKPFLKSYEIQLALKNKFGGLIDINTIHNDLYNKEYEEIFLSNVLTNKIILNKAKIKIPVDTIVIYKQIYKFILENESTSADTIKNHFNLEFNKMDIDGHCIYEEKLLKLKEKRDIYKILNSYSSSILSENISTNNMISSMVHELNISYQNNNHNATSIETAINEMINDINNDKFDGLDIGLKFPQLNCLMRGLLRGKLIEVCGASGHGKTTLACNLVDCVSVKQKYKTLFLSGEMTPKEMALKQLSISSNIPTEDIISRKSNLTPEILKPILDSRLFFDTLPILEETTAFLERQILLHGHLDLLVWDYLQLTLSITNEPRHIQLAKLTRLLKQFAQKYDIPVVAIAQLNRESSNKDVAEMVDIGGSYGMVADADIGMTIKRKKDKSNTLSDGNAEINLDKSRYTKDKIIIPVYFKGATSTIYEVT